MIAGIIVWYVFAESNDSNTVSMLHMNGTDGSTTFTDNAAGGTHTWTANGNAQIDTAQSKFGGASGLFDGTGDYLSAPDSDDWNFGSGDFTIDFWFNVSSIGADNDTFFEQHSSGWASSWLSEVLPDNTINFSNTPAVCNATTVAISGLTGSWHHVAYVRNGNNFYIFVDGVSKATATCSGAMPDIASNFSIGGNDVDNNHQITGSLDEFRVSKGIARWTANFTPPGCEYNGACPPPPKVPDIMVFE